MNNPTHIKQLIGEDSSCDFKESLERKQFKSWLKSVSAFTNGFGGLLLFGVNDKGVTIKFSDTKGDADFINDKAKIFELYERCKEYTNMKKIALNSNCRTILLTLMNDKRYDIKDDDTPDINNLINNNLITATPLMNNKYSSPMLTLFGKVYCQTNPKLSNPSIWDDKKYLITTSISVLALVLSFISMLK